MAIRPAFPLLSDLLVADGLAGGQTLIGDTQAGGDVAVQDNTTEVGGMEFFGPIAIDRTGPVTRVGVKDYNPQHELSLPADVYFQGLGTGALSLFNGVLTLGGAVGSIFNRDTSGTQPIIAPINSGDALTLGPEDAVLSPATFALVNLPASFSGARALLVRTSAAPILTALKNGNVGVNTLTPASAEGAGKALDLSGCPLVFESSVGWEFEGLVTSVPTLQTTASAWLRGKKAGTLYYTPFFAAAGALPADPTNLVAIGNAYNGAANSQGIVLTWTDNANNEDTYRVERSNDGVTSWAEIVSLGANSGSYTNNNLTFGVLKYYRVRAANVSGFSNYTPVVSDFPWLLDTMVRGTYSATSMGSASLSGNAWTNQSGVWGTQKPGSIAYAYVATHTTDFFDLASMAGQFANGVITAQILTPQDAAGIFWRGNSLNATHTSQFFYACHYYAGAGKWDVLFWNNGWTNPSVVNVVAPAAGDWLRVTLQTTSPQMQVDCARQATPTTWINIYTSSLTDDGASGFCSHFTASALHGLKAEGTGAFGVESYAFSSR